MNNVRMVKLGDVLTQRKEKIFVEDPLQAKLISVRLYGKGALQREIGDGKVPKAFTGYIGHTGQLVLSRIWARKGAIALIPHDLEGVVVTNEFPLFDVDETQVIPKYLIQLLTSNNFGPTLERASSGSSGQNRVRENKFLEISISLPPLEEQKRIVSILDKAKSIQKARERQLAALDELASSLFVKYFGHPSLSPKYKTVSIGDICKVATGNSPSKKDINNYGNVIEWVKSDNLGGLHPSKAKEYLSEQGKDKGRVAPPGSILVTCIAGSRNSIGKCSLVDREITFNQQINAIYPSNNILSDFLYYQIKIFPYLVQEKISGGMKGIVNKSKFESIKIILPPKEIQEEFSKITQRIRIQKEYAQKSLDLFKNLFSSLEITLFDH